MNKFYISLWDKENKRKSKRVLLEDIIYNQNEIEFKFEEFGIEEYATLSYNDFLFLRENYDVVFEVEKEVIENE